MSSKRKVLRCKWLTIRLSVDEQNQLVKSWKTSTCRSFSEYARNVLLKQPVLVYYRSKSADDFLQEMIHLKNELNAIGNNFNQAVHKLHTLERISEIKAWAILTDAMRQAILQKTIDIKDKLNEIHEQWSQK